MKLVYNSPLLKKRRQELRVRQTEAEALLWNLLRDRQLFNMKFYRQYSVGPYILDFYCPKLRLAIELDGAHHSNPDIKKYDDERDDTLRSEDIHLLRFWNHEIIQEPEAILNKIMVIYKDLAAPLS